MLELARTLLIPEGYEIQPTMDHPYLIARYGASELVISLQEEAPQLISLQIRCRFRSNSTATSTCADKKIMESFIRNFELAMH